MIPYFTLNTFYLGPVPIHIWGLMVALGILAGACLNVWLAKQRGQSTEIHWDLAFWVSIGAMIGARLFLVLFYQPSYYLSHPLEIIAIWNGGMSIVGGFFGAAIAGIAFLKRKKVDIHAYVDTAIFGLPVGLCIGRLGCFLIHDHPGTATSFFLGVKYPDGVVRHDLGLDESILAFFIAIVFFVLWRKKAPRGSFTVAFLILYGIGRFLLDFLRATTGPIVDARYLGLTPAQYVCLWMVFLGVFLGFRYNIFNRYGSGTLPKPGPFPR